MDVLKASMSLCQRWAQTGVCDSVLVGSRAPVTVPLLAILANVTGLAEMQWRLSFNHWSLRTTHLIRLNLRFTAARVTQPNPGVNQLITDPPWPPSLSPPRRWGRCGNSANEPGSQTRGDIDLYIKRSTVSMTELCSLFPSWEQGSGLITPQVEEAAWRPLGPELCQCVWIYISACHQLYVRVPSVPAAFPSPRFTVIFGLYRDATVSRAAPSACGLCWFPPAWHSGLTTDSARHLHLRESNYITYNGSGRS